MAGAGNRKSGGYSSRKSGGGGTGLTAAEARANATDARRSLFSGALRSTGDLDLDRAERVETLSRRALNRNRPRVVPMSSPF